MNDIQEFVNAVYDKFKSHSRARENAAVIATPELTENADALDTRAEESVSQHNQPPQAVRCLAVFGAAGGKSNANVKVEGTGTLLSSLFLN